MGHQGMKSSLVSREVIADSVELTMRGHCYDALIGLAGCDKSLPGHDDGDVPPERAVDLHLWRLDPAGHFPRQAGDRRRTSSRRSACISVGKMSDDDLDELRSRSPARRPAPAARQFTANTMATVSEAIGLALPYSAGAPAPYEIRDRFCMAAGEKIMELIARNIRPRDIVTRKALENAATVVAASGGSTNAGAASAGDRA